MGFFDQQPIASATNSAAQQVFGRTGKMAKRTVGGLFGGALPNPNNVPTPQQTLGLATGNQYAPMHQAPLAMAPTTQAGYGQQMQAQNPGGNLFGGALPALGTSPGGATRPMFTGPPAAPESNPGFDKSAFAKSHGLYFNPGTGTISGQSLEGMEPGAIRSMQTRGYGFGAHTPAAPVAEADRYSKLGLVAPSQRSGGPNVTAKQTRMLARSAAQKEQFEQGLGLASPNAYASMKDSAGRMALAKSQQDSTNAFRESDLGLRRDALKQQATLAAEREKGATDRAKLGLAGKGVDETGKPLDTRTEAEKIAAADKIDLRGKSKAEQELLLKDLPAPVRERLLKEANTPGLLGRLANTPFGDVMGTGHHPFSWLAHGADALSRAFGGGYQTPRPARPARKGKPIGSSGVSGSY